MEASTSPTQFTSRVLLPPPVAGLRRVAFVSNSAFSLYQFRLPIIEEFLRTGYEVYCIAPVDRHADKLVSQGINFTPLALSGHGKGASEQVRSTRALISIYRELKPDFIFHYTIKPNIFGTIAARWAGIPSVAVVTGLGALVDLSTSLIDSLVKYSYGWAARRSREVWFLNDYDLGYFQGRDWLTGTRHRVLPSEGIRLSDYPARRLRERNGPLRILYAGRILRAKGLEVLAKASELLQERGVSVRIEVLGFMETDNPDAIPLPQFTSWINRGLIKYRGGSEDVPPYLERAHVVVLPSYREGMSRILLEALATARPIITTDVPGCRELTQHGLNGLIFPAGDAQALASACEHLANLDHKSLRAMGHAGRKLVEQKHSVTEVAIVYGEFLRKLSKESNRNVGTS